MMLTCALPAFAEDGDDDDSSSVRRIPSGTKVVTSSTLDDGVIERLRVKTIYVPASVTTIKEGALTGYANVTNVYVENSKDNITIESGALPTGTNIVYTEKPSPPPATTTTTKAPSSTTTTTTKKDEESTTKKDDEDDKTTKKDDGDDKSTTKKTTKKTTTTKKNGKTVSSKATTSNPKDRTTVQHKPLTIKSTKAKKTTVKGPLIPEVEVDPDTIIEEPDPGMEEDITTVTFSGEAITDKDGTIIGFEDPENQAADSATSGESVAWGATIAGVTVVGLSAIGFLFLKFRRRP